MCNSAGRYPSAEATFGQRPLDVIPERSVHPTGIPKQCEREMLSEVGDHLSGARRVEHDRSSWRPDRLQCLHCDGRETNGAQIIYAGRQRLHREAARSVEHIQVEHQRAMRERLDEHMPAMTIRGYSKWQRLGQWSAHIILPTIRRDIRSIDIVPER